jgi:hypothetical protein
MIRVGKIWKRYIVSFSKHQTYSNTYYYILGSITWLNWSGIYWIISYI